MYLRLRPNIFDAVSSQKECPEIGNLTLKTTEHHVIFRTVENVK